MKSRSHNCPENRWHSRHQHHPAGAASLSRPVVKSRWPRTVRHVSFLAAAFALTGCGSLLLTPSTDFSDVAVPVAWSNGTAAPSPTALAQWWQRFNDSQLTTLVTQALQANNDVRTAQAALRQSRAQRDVAGAGLLPTVNAAASAQRSKAGDNNPVNSYQAGFDAGGSRMSSVVSRAASQRPMPIPGPRPRRSPASRSQSPPKSP